MNESLQGLSNENNFNLYDKVMIKHLNKPGYIVAITNDKYCIRTKDGYEWVYKVSHGLVKQGNGIRSQEKKTETKETVKNKFSYLG